VLIYLDSSNLIDLCQGKACINLSNFAEWLERRSHKAVFSLQTLIELSDPLRIGNILEVRKDLNSLEQLPHIFVNEGRICQLELYEAIKALDEGRKYRFEAVCSFSSRLDGALDLFGEPQNIVEAGSIVPTAAIVNYRMSECILDLWRRDPLIFDVQRRHEADWKRVIEADRALEKPPSLEGNFVKKMAGDLRSHRISFPPERVEELAGFVYSSPERCPGIRLQYETQHQFRLDKNSSTRASDIIDLTRIPAVPYVDFFITDKRMMEYSRRAAKVIERSYAQLFGDLRAVLAAFS